MKKTTYTVTDLTRELKATFPEGIPNLMVARDIVDALNLLLRRALLEGKTVHLAGIGVIEALHGLPQRRQTPKGTDWTGITKPRIRAAIAKEMAERMQEDGPVTRVKKVARKASAHAEVGGANG